MIFEFIRGDCNSRSNEKLDEITVQFILMFCLRVIFLTREDSKLAFVLERIKMYYFGRKLFMQT